MKPAIDSLVTHSSDNLTAPMNDSLEALRPAAEPLRPVLDSLWGRYTEAADTLQQGARSLEITALEAFGPEARLVAAGREVLPYSESVTDHPIFQGILLLLAAAYALMVCAHLHEIVGSFVRQRNDEGRPTPPSQAIHTSAIIGLLLMAAFVVRLCEGTLSELYGTMTLLVASLGACVGVVLFQSGLLQLIGRIVLMRDLTEGIIALKVLHFSVGTLLLTPPVLLLLLCPPGEGWGWLFLLALMGGMVIFLFIKETFKLFLAKKVSIFHWFLYLCTVECFPISLVWLLAVRW